MLKATFEGQIPQIESNLKQVLDKIGKYMVGSVQQNFAEGGRPAWEPIKSVVTGRPLFRSGKLFSSIRYEVGETSVEITAGEGLGPYPFLQQFGKEKLTTHVSERSKAFFWVMWFNTKEERWKKLALKPLGDPLTFRIPARPYMMFQPEDIDFITNILEAEVITITDAGGKKTTLGGYK
jgi:phage gpG-like protein